MNNFREFFYFPAQIEEHEAFKKMVKISIALHVAVFLIFGIKASFFSGEPIQLDPTIHVDMVGLPDKMARLPEPGTKKIEEALPKTEVKLQTKAPPKPEIVLHPKHGTKKAIDRIR